MHKKNERSQNPQKKHRFWEVRGYTACPPEGSCALRFKAVDVVKDEY